MAGGRYRHWKEFQFPPPRGGEPDFFRHCKSHCISIPAPARGRTEAQQLKAQRDLISIPAPARGRTAVLPMEVMQDAISIPAPARGRTAWKRNQETSYFISIPAPARGRTLNFCRWAVRLYFNSRPREGANFTLMGACQVSGYFNSRPREGANPKIWRIRATALFQFPPPRGGELFLTFLS